MAAAHTFTVAGCCRQAAAACLIKDPPHLLQDVSDLVSSERLLQQPASSRPGSYIMQRQNELMICKHWSGRLLPHAFGPWLGPMISEGFQKAFYRSCKA